MFASKAGAYPNTAPVRSTPKALTANIGLGCKAHQTHATMAGAKWSTFQVQKPCPQTLDYTVRLIMDKHSSLFVPVTP
jgi:hypothetical protein